MTNYKIDRGVPIPKTKLHPNPWNPNHMKPRQQSAVEESIKSYGQVLELLVRPHPEIDGAYQIIDGEHRFNVLPDTVYCNVIHGLPDAEAKKLTIVMNETRGSADKIELAQLLAELDGELEDLKFGLPYEDNELEELIALADVDWDKFTEESFDEPDPLPDDPTDDGYIRVTAAMTPESLDTLNQAQSLIGDSHTLSGDKQVALGEVIAIMASEYIAKPMG